MGQLLCSVNLTLVPLKWTFVLAWGVLQALAFLQQFKKQWTFWEKAKKYQQTCFLYVASTKISRKAKTVKTCEIFPFLIKPNHSDSVNN